MTSAKIKKNSEINSEVIGEQFYERFRDYVLNMFVK